MVLRGVVEPIPEDVDAALMAIRIGQRLGVPALAVASLPPYWQSVAAIDLDVESLAHKRAGERAKARQQTMPRARRR